VVVRVTLLDDADAISSRWLTDLSLASLIEDRLNECSSLDGHVDVVAIGKASREMARAAQTALGERLGRVMVISDVGSASETSIERILIGEHPIPGEGSLRAGTELTSFLQSDGHGDSTLFLLSGGASSLCVFPAPPLTLDDLGEIWRDALRAGVDITTLNQIRATTSLIAGGALLRYVHSAHSESLILVDNVVSGAQWVASAMTFDYTPSREDAETLWARIGVDPPLRARMLRAFEDRSRVMEGSSGPVHANVVLGEPAMMLRSAIEEASRRGYHVIDQGFVVGDVAAVAREWGEVARNAGTRTALVGVGEVTVQVEGGGQGGRCQEFSWRMAKEFGGSARPSSFVARASDGRDFIEGVGGAWVTDVTLARIEELGLDWSEVAQTHDTYPAFRALGQLLDGGHTGWNLCDLYLALVD